MRVALVHYSAPPVIGGVETILDAHARLLRAADHEVRIVAQRGEADVLIRDPRDLPPALAGCDTVIVHNILTMPFDPALTEEFMKLAASDRTTRWIAWIHDIAACNPDYAPATPILSQASPHFEYVAISGLRARQFAALTGIIPCIIPNGIDPIAQLALPPAIAAFATRYDLLSRQIVLLHPTRLLRRKNVELGIAVTAALRASGIDAALIVTGAPDPHNPTSAAYAEKLRNSASDRSLENAVLFAGEHFPTGPDAVAILYRLADTLFFPSRQEGFGLPLIEAALHRLPIFCADIDPLNTLLDTPRALHTFPLDTPPQEIAHRIASVLETDPAHQARRETLRRYAWPTIWQTHLSPLLA